ncbi:MAG: DUF883 family protein [Verrucomicrobiota bacterium]
MNKQGQAVGDDLSTLAEDARELLSATAGVAGDKVSAARERLAAALENGKEIYGQVREKAVQGVKATDRAVRENPYKSVGIALGVGAVIGFLIARQCSRNDD